MSWPADVAAEFSSDHFQVVAKQQAIALGIDRQFGVYRNRLLDLPLSPD